MPFLRITQRWSGRDPAPRAGADHLSTSYRNLLRTPGLPSLFGSISLMKFGGGVIQLTLILYVLQTWESSELAGAVVLVSWLPGIVVSPVAGVLMDRVRRAPLVALDCFVAGVTTFAIVALARAEHLEPWSLLILVGLASVTIPFGDTGLRTPLAVVPESMHWDRTNALESALASVTSTAAPATAGILIGIGQGELGLAVGGAFMVAAGVAMLRVQEPEPVADGALDIKRGFADLHASWREPAVRRFSSIVVLDDIAIGILQVALPVWMLGRYGATGLAVGLGWAAFNLTSLGVTLALGTAGTAGREHRIVSAGLLVQVVGFTLLVLEIGTWWVVACMAVAGATIGSIDVAMFSLLQRTIEPSRLAGANAVALAVTSFGVPIGAAAGGFVAGWAPSLALAVAPIIAATAALSARFILVDATPLRRSTAP